MKATIKGLELKELSPKEKDAIMGGRINAGNGRDERINAGNGRDERINAGSGRDEKK